MDKITKGIGTIILAAITVAVMATFGGTIVWLLYPHIHSLFPTAASNGIIPNALGWWDSVCVTWLFSVLFKTTNTTSNKTDK